MNGDISKKKFSFSDLGLRSRRKIFVRSDDECNQHVGVMKYNGTLTIMFIMSVLIVAMFFIIVLADIKNLQGNFNGISKNHESHIITSTKENLELRATLELKQIADNIRKEIIDSFDMDELEKDLNNGIIPAELSSIFYKNLNNKCTVMGLNPDSNNIIVCNENGVIDDFSKVYASHDKKTPRDWEHEAEYQVNKELYFNSIDAILDQNDKIFYVEQYKYFDSDEKADDITYMDIDAIMQIYSAKGLDGLKPYTFLLPVYIDDYGDIFGKHDIQNGHLVKNNKFIIIQRYNLYDYIKQHNIDNFFHNNINRQIDKLILTMQVGSIIIIAMLLMILSALIRNVNTISDGSLICKKCDNCEHKQNCADE